MSSSYGKYTPYKDPLYVSDRRRHSTDMTTFSDSRFGIKLAEVREQNEQLNEQKGQDVKTSAEVLQKSSIRLREAIVPQVGETNKLFSVVWVLIYVGLFAAFVITFYDLVDKYTKYPKSVDFSIETSSEGLEFPGVTICNENPVRKSVIGRLRKYSDLLTLDEFVSYYFNFSVAEIESGDYYEIDCPPGLQYFNIRGLVFRQ